jgi:MraZ protein
VAERLTEKIRSGLASQDALRAFSANAAEVKPDSQGRILVPQRLREFAGLDRDVVVIGAMQRIEIWDAARWSALSAHADESLVHAVTSLGI